MARSIVSSVVLGAMSLWAGCSRTEPAPVAQASTGGTVETTAGELAEPNELVLDSEPKPLIPPSRPLDTNVRIAMLAREIEGHRRRGYEDQAITARQEMVQAIVDQYGADSWQARGARLALDREVRLSTFTPAEAAANEAAEARTREANELWQSGKHEEACAALVASRTAAIALWGETSYGVANLLDQEARWRQSSGEISKAEPLFRQALLVREQVFTPLHPETISTRRGLGTLLQSARRYDEAETLLRRCAADAETVWGPQSAECAAHNHDLALLQLEVGQNAAAADLFAKVVENWRTSLGPEDASVGEAYLNLGRAQYALHDYPQAAANMRQALTILTGSLGPDAASTRRARINLGLTLMAQRQYEEAESFLRADLSGAAQHFGKNHPETAEGLLRVAILYGNQGRYREALPYAERAAEVHCSTSGAEHPLTRNADSIVGMIRGKLQSAAQAGVAEPVKQ